MLLCIFGLTIVQSDNKATNVTQYLSKNDFGVIVSKKSLISNNTVVISDEAVSICVDLSADAFNCAILTPAANNER